MRTALPVTAAVQREGVEIRKRFQLVLLEGSFAARVAMQQDKRLAAAMLAVCNLDIIQRNKFGLQFSLGASSCRYIVFYPASRLTDKPLQPCS